MSNETPTVNKGERPRKPGGKSVNLVVNMSPDRKRDVEKAARNLGISASEYIRLKVFDDIQTRFEERNRTGIGNQFSSSTFPETWDEFYRLTTARFLELASRTWRERDDLRKRQTERLIQASKEGLNEESAKWLLVDSQIETEHLNQEHLKQFLEVSSTAREHAHRLANQHIPQVWKQ
jgi:hypothetical protein